MKTLIYTFVGAAILALFGSISKPESKPKNFTKDVWIEIDLKDDSTLFKPYSDSWDGAWSWENPIPEFNYQKYKESFQNNSSNLWNIIHPHIVGGSINVYSPTDPENFMVQDQGGLRFPLLDITKDSNFLNSEIVRDNLFFFLGNRGPMPDMPLINVYGEDSIDTQGNFVYPPREYYWYSDSRIIKFRPKETVILDKEGKEKKRLISSIAPIVQIEDYDTGQILGEKELIWLDFNELKPILKEKFYLDSNGKPVSFLDYFEKRKFKFKVIKEENKVLNVVK